MKKFFKWQSLLMMGVVAGFGLLAAGCDETHDLVPGGNGSSANEVLNIPRDEDATEAPEVSDPNAKLSNPQVQVCEQDGYQYLSIDMTGVWNESAASWLELSGTKTAEQNLWITVDGQPKGVDVYNNALDNSRKLLTDVVFLVDNSGSMDDEAEAIANSIIAWSQLLSESGLDVQVGCVGYGDSTNAIDGAFNMDTPEALEAWMKSNGYGTNRTHRFGGEDAAVLSTLAASKDYQNGSYNECGMVALHFAHDNFDFRGGANRVYVNFTDEPNQPAGIEKWSVEYLNPENNNWRSNYGTVHSVFSDESGENYCNWTNLYAERPWLMADYTGGTKLFTDRRFTNFTLENLPVTGAMQNSYVMRITNIANLLDGQEHQITITVFTKDGAVMACKTIIFKFEK